MNNRVGIVVDGEGDYASLRKRFQGRYRVLKTDGPRGHTAKPVDIARKSKKQIAMLKAFRCARVIVLLDCEERQEGYSAFVQSLRQEFDRIGLPIPIHIAVANLMIENWYLADIGYLAKVKGFLRKGTRQKNFEGRHGKDELKKCMVKGVYYSETKHGPELFADLRFAEARKNSKSFAEFLDCCDTS
jgi:hypothetical protein